LIFLVSEFDNTRTNGSVIRQHSQKIFFIEYLGKILARITTEDNFLFPTRKSKKKRDYFT